MLAVVGARQFNSAEEIVGELRLGAETDLTADVAKHRVAVRWRWTGPVVAVACPYDVSQMTWEALLEKFEGKTLTAHDSAMIADYRTRVLAMIGPTQLTPSQVDGLVLYAIGRGPLHIGPALDLLKSGNVEAAARYIKYDVPPSLAGLAGVWIRQAREAVLVDPNVEEQTSTSSP